MILSQYILICLWLMRFTNCSGNQINSKTRSYLSDLKRSTESFRHTFGNFAEMRTAMDTRDTDQMIATSHVKGDKETTVDSNFTISVDYTQANISTLW